MELSFRVEENKGFGYEEISGIFLVNIEKGKTLIKSTRVEFKNIKS